MGFFDSTPSSNTTTPSKTGGFFDTPAEPTQSPTTHPSVIKDALDKLTDIFTGGKGSNTVDTSKETAKTILNPDRFKTNFFDTENISTGKNQLLNKTNTVPEKTGIFKDIKTPFEGSGDVINNTGKEIYGVDTLAAGATAKGLSNFIDFIGGNAARGLNKVTPIAPKSEQFNTVLKGNEQNEQQSADIATKMGVSQKVQDITKGAGEFFGEQVIPTVIAEGLTKVLGTGISKIPMGDEILSILKKASSPTAPFIQRYGISGAQSAVTGAIASLALNNKKTVAQNALDNAGAFAAFHALLYPIAELFRPAFTSIARATGVPNNTRTLANEALNKMEGQTVQKTMYFKNPNDESQIMEVTAHGIKPVGGTDIVETGTKVTDIPTLTKIDIEVFKKEPSLYNKLKKWLKDGGPVEETDFSAKSSEQPTKENIQEIVEQIKSQSSGIEMKPSVSKPATTILGKSLEQIANQVQEQAKFNTSVSENLNNSIPKELQPLAEEARKYKTPEEFIKNTSDKNIDFFSDTKLKEGYQNKKPTTLGNIFTDLTPKVYTNISNTPVVFKEFNTNDNVSGFKPSARISFEDGGKNPIIEINTKFPYKNDVPRLIKKTLIEEAEHLQTLKNNPSFMEGKTPNEINEYFADKREIAGKSNAEKRINKQLTEFHKQATQSKEPKFNTEARITLLERPVEPQRVTEYKDRLKLKGADPVLVDAIITPTGNRAYGVSVGGHISLEKVVEHLTEDHEVFHQVFQNMEKMRIFNKFDKGELMAEAKDLYGDFPEAQLEEEMAKDFQQYVNEQENNKSSSFFGKIKEFFDRLFSSIKRLFKTESDIKEFYRTMREERATEETVINDNMPESFNQKVKEGVLDFRIQNDVANFLEEVPVEDAFTDSGDLTLKTIQKLEGRTTVSKQYISDLTNSGDIKQVERDLIRSVLSGYPDGAKIPVKQFVEDVKVQLLPLEIQDVTEGPMGGPRYESVALPSDLRGDVQNYQEKIYESSIKTSAGGIHFGGDSKNYFGHTRIEDMDSSNDTYHPETNKLIAGNQEIRRVIEVQSDLYQKGNLERENLMKGDMSIADEKKYGTPEEVKQWEEFSKKNLENGLSTEEKNTWDKLSKTLFERAAKDRSIELSKLQQYNDPTAHFRMVREEIRKAAQDGKNKLQFPTGETAMKIEGLGQGDSGNFSTSDGEMTLRPEILKIGREIKQASQRWIITDVLGDGKFKAIPKGINELELSKINYGPRSGRYEISDGKRPGEYFDTKADGEAYISEQKESSSESFDISGKLDTNNPIYKFYEKDLARYLKNNYDAVPVTDDKGVTWYEVPINKNYADLPVPAFNQKPNIEQLQKQRERYEQSLMAYEENPRAHIQAYGEDRSQIYKDKIKELTQRIKDIKNPEFNSGNKLADLRATLAHAEARMEVNPADKVDYLKTAIEQQEQIIKEHPGKKLQKFISKKEGQFVDLKDPNTAKTPAEKTRIVERNKKVLSKAESAFEGTKFSETFDDPEVIREAIDEYQKEKESLESMKLEKILASKEFKQQLKLQKQILKEEIKNGKLQIKDEEELDKMAKDRAYSEMPKSIKEVIPPITRGEIQSPELDFSKWKDKSALRLTRETFERDIENIAPKSDELKIKDFLINPIRENETNRVKFNNALRIEARDKMNELGLRRGTTNSELIQKYGEGLISVDELKREAPEKWEDIQKAATYYRNKYDMLLDRWNEVRKKFGYPEVGKRPDYFRHFDEINFLAKNYGLINNADNLPTDLAGKTEFFKPGKPFTTAELHRTGNKTKYDAIAGFDNYIDTVSKQIFHTDSIQRGRALEKYIERVSRVARTLQEPIHLQNFIGNLREYINNGLAGKQATADRTIEHYAGRPIISAFERISKLIGKNIIVGNISTALSHLVTLPLIATTTDKIPLMKGLTTTLTSPFSKSEFDHIDGQESSFLVRRYPIQKTMRSRPENAEQALSFFFETTDKFKSRLAVSSKYYEGIKKGFTPEESMKQADTYAGKVLGDYSYGQRPNLMNAKSMSIIAQFQLGLNDSLSVLFHDIPEDQKTYTQDENGEYTSKKNNWGVVSKFVQFAIFSFLFNQVIKNIRGSGKGIDPIDMGLTLTGLNEEGAGKSLPARFGLAGTDLAGELPFSSVFTGNFPLATAIKTPIQDLSKGSVKEFFADLASTVASPIGGGLQAKKTIEGINAYRSGIVNSKSGNPNFAVNKSPVNAVKMAVFGKNSTQEAQSYYSSIGQQSPGQDIINQLKDLKQKGKLDEAKKIIDGLSSTDLKNLKSAITANKAKETKQSESDMIPIVQQVISLKKLGKLDEAKKIIDGLSDDQKKNFIGAATMLKKATTSVNDSFGDNTTTWDKQSFITHIATLAKASTMHPVQFFENMFDGAGDWRITGVKNGQLIVNRMSLSASETIKKNAGQDDSNWKLDHIWPLEAGGNNSTDNLQLIPTDQWSSNTEVEKLIADKLSSGTISGSQAKEFAIRYKAGQGEKLSPAYLNIYKNKYGGKPITREEIEQY